MNLEQRPPAAITLTQIRPLTAIFPLDNGPLLQVFLGVGAAVPAPFVVQPAIGVFRPPADWTRILGGGVCESARLWYCGCKHTDSPMNRFLQGSQPPWGPYFSQILTNAWEVAKASPRLLSTA